MAGGDERARPHKIDSDSADPDDFDKATTRDTEVRPLDALLDDLTAADGFDDPADQPTTQSDPLPYPDLPGVGSGGGSGPSVNLPDGPIHKPIDGDDPGSLKDLLTGNMKASQLPMGASKVFAEGSKVIIHDPMASNRPPEGGDDGGGSQDGGGQEGGGTEGGGQDGGGSTGSGPSSQSLDPVEDVLGPPEEALGTDAVPAVDDAPFFDEADAWDADPG